MIRNIFLKQTVPGLLVACMTIASGALAATAAASYETPPGLRAGDVLPAGLLRSENHQVLDEIQYDGYLFRFELETDYGTEVVTSKALLKIRVHEATAIAAASNAMLQRTEAIESGVVGQSRDRDYLSARPADSRSDLDGAVQFSQIRLSGKKKMRPGRPAGDNVTEVPGSSSPASSDPAFGVQKRAVAAGLQMDVYTTNKVAQETLVKLARARAAGNETEALFYEQWARMLAVYDEQVEALGKLSLAGSTVTALTTSGVLVLAQPVDIVYWSGDFDTLTGALESSSGGKSQPGRELVVTGRVTNTARS